VRVIAESQATPVDPDPQTRQFYVDALSALDRAEVPYVVGGGYAMAHYTGIRRATKDLDIFVKAADRDRTLTTLTAAGYRTEFFYPFWISKALHGEAFIDILYNSGNGLCPVDDDWFRYSRSIDVHGYATRLVPPEEQLWSKAFVQDRDRFDGADVIHLILRHGEHFDWRRLLRRFSGGHERVLLAHLLLFGYVYPSKRECVPTWVLDQLNAIVRDEPEEDRPICRGANVAQRGYGPVIRERGYIDGRLIPFGPLRKDEIEQLPKE
jgi:hypothetical protein